MVVESVIEVSHLKKTYQEGLIFRKRFEALRDVSLEVHRGEVFGLLGPNGAGKTTLIKILLGILHATQGQARVLGKPAGSKAARRRIGYLPENLTFPRHHTGRDSLYFYGRLNLVSETGIRSREKELLELVGLSGRESEPVRKYSKGMRQRLGLAQAMLHDPDILIMDEPTDGLDPVGRSQIREVIDQLRSRGKTVFLNSHILQEVELICDRVAIMALGQLQGIGTIEELISRFHASLKLIVHLELQGDLAVMRAILSPYYSRQQKLNDGGSVVGTEVGLNGVALQVVPEERQSFELELASQSELDRIVDLLRKANISIWRLEPIRPRLEQVFMSIVTSAAKGQETSGLTNRDPVSKAGLSEAQL